VLRRWSVVAAVFSALALSGCASSAPSASSADSGVSSSGSTGAGTVSEPVSTTHRRRIHALGPLQTVERYWRDIGSGKYGVAFRYLAPGSVPQSQSQFVSDEQESGIDKVEFNGQLSARTGSSAMVAVTSLTTRDAQFGCRHWTGSYQLSKHGTRWLIVRAGIVPSQCSSGQSPSSTTSSTSSASDGTASSQQIEGPGSSSHATDVEFCSTHECIPNFPNGSGDIVQCVDGEWSHSGGLSGACSDHGGEQ
jgi:hypothetical protein